MSSQPVAAGDGFGGAIARRFARGGYHACVVCRSADKLEGLCGKIRETSGKATPFGVDARNEDPVVGIFEQVEKTIGPIEVAVPNVGATISIPVVDFGAREFFKIWEITRFFSGRSMLCERWSEYGAGTRAQGIRVAYTIIEAQVGLDAREARRNWKSKGE